jgi:hypothetical protein
VGAAGRMPPILVVHAEAVVEVVEDQAAAAAAELKSAMIAGMAPLMEPIVPAVELTARRSWGAESNEG